MFHYRKMIKMSGLLSELLPAWGGRSTACHLGVEIQRLLHFFFEKANFDITCSSVDSLDIV